MQRYSLFKIYNTSNKNCVTAESGAKYNKAFLITHICVITVDWSIPVPHCIMPLKLLWKTHQKQGSHAKMLLNKAITIKEIESLFIRIINMGPFNNEQLRQSLHFHALTNNYQHIHQYLMNLVDNSSFSFTLILYITYIIRKTW